MARNSLLSVFSLFILKTYESAPPIVDHQQSSVVLNLKNIYIQSKLNSFDPYHVVIFIAIIQIRR